MIYNGELVFKAYRNNSPNPMRKYDITKLSTFTKYARMEAWGAKLTQKYSNVFVQNNAKDQRWLYHIDQNGGYSGGQDRKKHILTDNWKTSQYRVFDLINGTERYDVPRVENSNDNSELRFRISGGRNEGLFISLTKMSDDTEVAK